MGGITCEGDDDLVESQTMLNHVEEIQLTKTLMPVESLGREQKYCHACMHETDTQLRHLPIVLK
jgi:hypothetical protein